VVCCADGVCVPRCRRYLRGQVTEKNDVYSFGVVLLELLSGRRALVSEQFDLVHWAASIIKGPPPILDKILDLSIKVSRASPA
jgi:serine/threonine protein kinase